VAIEIEAFASGVLTQILVPAGEMAPVGDPIGVIGEPGEKAAPAPKKEAPKVEAKPEEAPRTEVPAPKAEAPAPRAEGERIKSSPLARKVAADKGVELSGLTGSGPGGRIVKADVEAAASSTGAKPAAAAAPAPAGGGKKVPLSAMRKAIARRMVESKAPVPHFYVTMAVDMEAAMALRTQLNEKLEKDDKISVNDMIIKACALALRKHPSLNAVFAGDGILQPDEIAISVAVAIDDGLIAPDIHRADEKSIGTIAREVKDKARRAKEGKLSPDEYGRGTFTVSNLGMFGVEAFTAIITLPQSAAIAVGAVQKEPVVKDDQVVPGQVMRFTVSADHRVTDGAGSAQFAAEVKRLLETPLQLLI
jgi:pyruvate dehydrogenase E2 component (dihydrolipoamide acetyltransferase)